MSNMQKFFEALASDKEMQERAQKLNEPKPTSQDEVLAALVAFAAAEGYSFTSDEAKEYIKAKADSMTGQIPDDELDNVVGGEFADVSAKFVCIAAGFGDGCGCFFVGYGKDDKLCAVIGDDDTLCLTSGNNGKPCEAGSNYKCTWG